MDGISPERATKLRQATPALGGRLYLNHASASLPPATVTAALACGVGMEAALGTNDALRQNQVRLRSLHEEVAGFLGAKSRNIALVDATAVAWSMALAALTDAHKKISLITVRNEWGSNILAASSMARRGLLQFSIAPTLPNGRFDPKALAAAAAHADVVSVPLIPSSSGLMNPIAELRDALPTNTLLFVDAAQAAGQVPLDVETLGADLLVFPLRKWLRGPRGVAVMFLSDRALSRMRYPLLIDQAGAYWDQDTDFSSIEGARRFEKFDYYPGLRLGLSAALEEANAVGLNAIRNRIFELGQVLLDSFGRLDLPRPFEAGHLGVSGLWTFVCPEIATSGDVDALRSQGLSVAGVGSNYARLALADRNASLVARVSVHYFNTEDEIRGAADILARYISRKRH